MSIATLEEAKKVTTNNLEGKENGWLIELYKDGEKTLAYMTMIKPGMFKGYHLHRVRKARYFCVKGTVKIILYKNKQREEYVLSGEKPQRLFIPDNIATGLLNIGNEDVWLINFPDPPYDPNLKDEQVEYTEEELERGITK
ncbi:WxcM-like domain-containing protein [Patescibacteria group bacterium]|nr:WxcM-like domain-containing protein [Patescibacteria group bacterium]MCL5433203.1 WxcM-like domain-containing protein [Patescibacteria group bacterium]